VTTNVLKLAAEQRERGHTDTIAIAAAEMIERVLTELEKPVIPSPASRIRGSTRPKRGFAPTAPARCASGRFFASPDACFLDYSGVR